MKLDPASIDIAPLHSHHDRVAFSCGNATLDRYLQTQAGQDTRRGLTRIFVATASDNPRTVMGFFTLSAGSILPEELPLPMSRRLPRQAVPAALVGRLAVDKRHAGRGLGRILLADAVKKLTVASETVAIAFLVVDPIDDAARNFYLAFGFVSLVSASNRMFLALPTREVSSQPVSVQE